MKNDSQANMESGKERKALTSRQREVFEFIKERIQSTSRPPTLREIGVRFGISSTNGVRSILHALAKKQYIERAKIKYKMAGKPIRTKTDMYRTLRDEGLVE